MKYLSDYALGEKFIVTPQIAEMLGYPFTQYLNAKCYVDEIRIGIVKSYASIALLEDYNDGQVKRSKYHTITTFSYTIDDYYKNQNLVHAIPTCASIHDVIIDEYSRKFFEIYCVSAVYKNGKPNIRYYTNSSSPNDDDTITFTEDKLKFFIDNNIYRHAKWDMSATTSDTPVENK